MAERKVHITAGGGKVKFRWSGREVYRQDGVTFEADPDDADRVLVQPDGHKVRWQDELANDATDRDDLLAKLQALDLNDPDEAEHAATTEDDDRTVRLGPLQVRTRRADQQVLLRSVVRRVRIKGAARHQTAAGSGQTHLDLNLRTRNWTPLETGVLLAVTGDQQSADFCDDSHVYRLSCVKADGGPGKFFTTITRTAIE